MSEGNSAVAHLVTIVQSAGLYGLTEVGAYLRLDEDLVSLFRSVDLFPEPVAELSSGPIWIKAQLDEYLALQSSKTRAVPSESSAPSTHLSLPPIQQRIYDFAIRAAKYKTQGGAMSRFEETLRAEKWSDVPAVSNSSLAYYWRLGVFLQLPGDLHALETSQILPSGQVQASRANLPNMLNLFIEVVNNGGTSLADQALKARTKAQAWHAMIEAAQSLKS